MTDYFNRLPKRIEGQLLEHGDLLSELKGAQEGPLGGCERELTTLTTHLITGEYFISRLLLGEHESMGIRFLNKELLPLSSAFLAFTLCNIQFN